MYYADQPSFRVGHRAERAEFRHSDINGNAITPAGEGDTARAERITRLQALRDASGPREAPPTAPVAVLAEWLARNPQQRTGAFGKALAERGAEMIPKMAIELPGREPSGDALTRRGRLPATVQRMQLPGR